MVVPAQSFYADAARSLNAREIRPIGVGRAARPRSSSAVSCSPPKACSTPSASGALPFLPGTGRPGPRAATPPPSGRARQRRAPLARRRLPRSRTPRCRARRGPPGDRSTGGQLDKDPAVDVIVIAAGAAAGRGPAAVLRRGPDRAVRLPHAGRVSAIGHADRPARCSTWSRTSAPRPTPTPPSGWCPTWRRWSWTPARPRRAFLGAWLAREQHALDMSARPSPGSPTRQSGS